MTRLVARTVVLRSTNGASLLGAWLPLAAMPDGAAQGAMLLALPESEEALCLSCHEAADAGATTDVETGVQYAPGGVGLRGGTPGGALRLHT